MTHPRVAAIIPAYNEEATVGEVVEAVRSSPLIDEVIVISDGSHDQTKAMAEAAGAIVHLLPKNQGKGAAMLHGITHTDAPVVIFFDADLLGLTPDHIERILLPVLSGSRVMNVGLRDRGFLNGLVPHLPLVGGERALMRHVIEGIPPKFVGGFMVESAMNYYCRSRGYPYGGVFLQSLKIRHKYEKVGWFLGAVQYIRMWIQVGWSMVWVRFARLFKQF